MVSHLGYLIKRRAIAAFNGVSSLFLPSMTACRRFYAVNRFMSSEAPGIGKIKISKLTGGKMLFDILHLF
jgi:hypothetical protein